MGVRVSRISSGTLIERDSITKHGINGLRCVRLFKAGIL
jgi:hypothetical protein